MRVYSSRGRTCNMYTRRSESRSLETDHKCTMLALKCALDALVWSIHFSSLSTLTTRSSTNTSRIGITHCARVSPRDCAVDFRSICNIAHFIAEIISCQSLDYLASALMLSCSCTSSIVFLFRCRFPGRLCKAVVSLGSNLIIDIKNDVRALVRCNFPELNLSTGIPDLCALYSAGYDAASRTSWVRQQFHNGVACACCEILN